MITLDDYLDSVARKRWAWGRMDCVQFGMGWASARSGRQCPTFLIYDSPEAAKAFLEAHGGLVGTVAAWMEDNGFERTETPDDGDIGVAPLPSDGPMNIAHAAVVIRRGPWWLAKSLRGFASVQAQGIPAWRIS